MSHADIAVHYAALQVALLKSRQLEASDALKDWADEWIEPDLDEESLGELLEEEEAEHGAD